jgi:hypothetical protein
MCVAGFPDTGSWRLGVREVGPDVQVTHIGFNDVHEPQSIATYLGTSGRITIATGRP